ncbi:MAG: alpha/beta hydrolase [Actinomycetota bacterium]|nr:alpha/beta hydrolase [Actinomycetota bacterium]
MALVVVAATLTASTLALPAATAGPQAQGASAAAAPVPSLAWTKCYKHFQCTTARVPLDYDEPDGAGIRIALIRLKAGNPKRRIGSLFLNPGGPGGSGVDMVRFGGRFLFSDEVRARFDLVGFDPRGIAASSPLRCFSSFEEALAVFPPMAFPVTRPEENVWVEADRALADACAQRGGAIIDHMSTANVARDLNLLRRAVGDSRLSFAGYSYGSYIGATYANMFPNNVRALLVDGVLDPLAWSTGTDETRSLPVSTRLRSDHGTYATLRQFFTLCNEGGDNCAFSDGSPRRRYQELTERLRNDPVEIPDGEGGTFALGYDELVAFTIGAMYGPGSWPSFAEFLDEVETMSDPEAATAALHALRAQLRGLNHEGDYPNFVESFPGVLCSDSDNPESVGAWAEAAQDSDSEFPYFGRAWTWISSICEPWPGQDADRYTGPFTKATHNQVLVVGNRYDPATRYRGAVKLRRLLPKSRLLTLEGWGHTSLGLSSCIDQKVNSYLLVPWLPSSDATCQPDVVPFAQPQGAARGPAEARRPLVIPSVVRLGTG